MGEFFNPEKGIWAWLSTMVDIVGLSVLWIFLCLPVVTIGPALVALSPNPVSDGGGYQALIGPMDERGV